MYNSKKVYAIVLAAGKGSRMHSETRKQFMNLRGLPLYLYSTRKFLQHPMVDAVVIVTVKESFATVKEAIAAACPNTKTPYDLTEGGKERYDSVYQGLSAIYRHIMKDPDAAEDESIVLIHDSARPMITDKIITDSITAAYAYRAAVVGMPVKDTIKLLDPEHFVMDTPDRKQLWLMQTPQSFDFTLVYHAYQKLMKAKAEGNDTGVITDDAMVVETFSNARVKIIEGSYQNIKVTTPEDIAVAELYLN